MRFGQQPARSQFFDRTHYVVDVHDQDRRAIFHEGGGADIFDLAETRIERLHHQLALPQKTIDDQAILGSAIAEHDDGQIIAGRLATSIGTVKHLMGSQ